jgi:hypothetical protein
MKTVMKTTLLLTLFVLTMVPAGLAQTTGTITITGTTPEAFSITNATDGTLTSTIALGSLTPATGGTLTQGTAQVRLRSNKAYKVTAQASALNFTGAGSADGGTSLAMTDVGFGITATDASGANVATGHTDTIVSGFDVSGGWPTVTNGLTPSFTKTLNDLTSATQVISGTRISARGNLSTNNNFALVTFGVATLPQYFTPNTSLSTTITLTISSN